MSDPYSKPGVNPYGYAQAGYGPAPRQENTLGLVGFIVSLLGFFVSWRRRSASS